MGTERVRGSLLGGTGFLLPALPQDSLWLLIFFPPGPASISQWQLSSFPPGSLHTVSSAGTSCVGGLAAAWRGPGPPVQCTAQPGRSSLCPCVPWRVAYSSLLGPESWPPPMGPGLLLGAGPAADPTVAAGCDEVPPKPSLPAGNAATPLSGPFLPSVGQIRKQRLQVGVVGGPRPLNVEVTEPESGPVRLADSQVCHMVKTPK